jgi:diaminohydroxyphosphoribosylaminopyrimidine deaminase / 5-amino-6-(5-phosphoribosylamino)uracil reductase
MPTPTHDNLTAWSHADHRHMGLALSLAAQSLTLSNPNPRVGCVLVDAQDHVIGQGHTQAAGHAHAEVMALRDAAAQGHTTRGATAYVTLEPCAHFGRTPPCANALVQANLARVVIATLDPNPQVDGGGAARLRAANIQVDVGLMGVASRELNPGFFSRMLRQRPWVRMKMAASLDGVSALPNGQSQWITSAQARADGHAWRARACAVATGVGTVLADDPSLDVREAPATRQPHLVIVDSRLQTPATAKLWQPERQVWLYHAQAIEAALPHPKARGHSCVNPQGKVDLNAMLQDLAAHEVNELHLEAGSALNASFLREGLVDELLIYLAPKWLGQGQGMSSFGPLSHVDQGLELHWLETTPVGPDLRVRASTHPVFPF